MNEKANPGLQEKLKEEFDFTQHQIKDAEEESKSAHKQKPEAVDADDFFDNIGSSTTVTKEDRQQRPRFNPRTKDIDTFGYAAETFKPNNQRGGRGGRGRGGYQQRDGQQTEGYQGNRQNDGYRGGYQNNNSRGGYRGGRGNSDQNWQYNQGRGHPKSNGSNAFYRNDQSQGGQRPLKKYEEEQ